MDAAGKVITIKNIVVDNPFHIPVSNLAPGNYVLRIIDDEGVINSKFSKF